MIDLSRQLAADSKATECKGSGCRRGMDGCGQPLLRERCAWCGGDLAGITAAGAPAATAHPSVLHRVVVGSASTTVLHGAALRAPNHELPNNRSPLAQRQGGGSDWSARA